MASSSSESDGEEDQEQDEEPLQRSEPSSPVKEEPEEEDEEKEVIPSTPLNDQKTKRRGRKLVIIEFVTLTFFYFSTLCANLYCWNFLLRLTRLSWMKRDL